MTEAIFLFLMLAVIPLCKYPIRYGNGFGAKESLFFLAGLAYVCKVSLFGGVYASSASGWFLLALATFGVASMMWCTNVEQGWQDVPKWVAMYSLFTVASSLPVKTVMLIAVAMLPAYLAYGLGQALWFKKDPLDRNVWVGRVKSEVSFDPDLKSRFVSMGGNTNHTGAFLAPYAFICLWLSVHVSPWFIPLVVLTLLGVSLTKCYASWVGIAFGACFVYPPYSLLGLLAVGATVAFVLMLRKWNRETYAEWFMHRWSNKEKSITARVYYLIVAYHMWRVRPIFGWGLRTYRKEVYDAQALLKGKYAELVTNNGEYAAYPQRTHNDLADSLVELGSIGFLLLLGFFVTVIYGSVASGNYILMAGVVCLIVNGLFFYTLSSFSYVPWMVLAACASGATVSAISLPFVAGLLLCVVMAKLGLDYVVKPHLSSMWLARANRKDDWAWQNRCLDKALELTPTDGPTVSAAIKVKAQADIFLSQHLAERAVHHYDGMMRAWGVWGVYGELLWKTGNLEGAKRALRYSLYLNPSFESARSVLNMVEAKGNEIIEAQKQKRERMEQFQRLANGRAA